MKVILIGAGIGGLSAAIALRAVGMETVVYESKPEIRFQGAGLGIGANAVMALHALGLGDAVLSFGKRMKEVRFVTERGSLLRRVLTEAEGRTNAPDHVIVHRGDLLQLLLHAIGADGRVVTGKTCIHVEQHKNGVKVGFDDGTTDEGDLLVAADGIRSAVRAAILPDVRPRYAGYTCWRAVVQADDALRYDPELFMEALGAAGRFGIAPMTGRSIYWFACVNAPAGDPAMNAVTAADLARRFAAYPEPVPQLLAASRDIRLLHHDIEYIPPLARFSYGRIVLLGDAAHATTPNLAQGAGQALEDAVVLAARLKHAADWRDALVAYDKDRVRRTERITRLSGRIGRVLQLKGRLPVALRNRLLPLLPQAVMANRLAFLHRVKLDKLV